MKKLFFVFSSWLLLVHASQAQTDTATVPYVYCEIVGQPVLSRKIEVSVDFGNQPGPHITKKTRLKDEQGERIKFNSMIDALNHMSREGWEFVQAYLSDDKSTHWLLRRKAEE